MSKPRSKSDDAAELRRKVMHRLADRQVGQTPPVPSTEAAALRLVHELQVHQIELELQNEELKHARAEVEVALARYTDLYDFAPVGYLTLGPEGAIRWLNLTAAAQLGTERARLVGARLGLFLAADGLPAFNEFLSKACVEGARASCELVLTPEDAAPLVLRLTSSAGSLGQECRVAVEDVTARRAAQEQLAAAQKMAAIGRLAGGVAHDFNNVLAVILGHAAFALESLKDADPVRADVLEIKAAAEQAAALTRQLLAYSRKQPMDAQVLDLNGVTASMHGTLSRLVGEHTVVHHVAEPQLGLVKADAVQLGQVLLNLALNARDAMPDGGTLTIETANVELDERGAAQHDGLSVGRYVRLSVTDTGCGMDEATVAQIFEPFFTTKERSTGTGFGLALVYGVVKQSGGDVRVRSELGQGTTVEVLLPRLVAATAAVRKRPASERPLATGETILVVEDERAIRVLAERVLRQAGYCVLTASSGDEALLVCGQHQHQISLVLTDVVMPRMTGPVLVERLAAASPEIKVLYMSGYTDDALDQHGLRPGVNLINKPFVPDELTRKVREVLDPPLWEDN